jgi:hypothetical protein
MLLRGRGLIRFWLIKLFILGVWTLWAAHHSILRLVPGLKNLAFYADISINPSTIPADFKKKKEI